MIDTRAQAKTGIYLPVREGGKDEGYVMGEGGKERDRAGGRRSVKAWLMSTCEMCLLSTEQCLLGSEWHRGLHTKLDQIGSPAMGGSISGEPLQDSNLTHTHARFDVKPYTWMHTYGAVRAKDQEPNLKVHRFYFPFPLTKQWRGDDCWFGQKKKTSECITALECFSWLCMCLVFHPHTVAESMDYKFKQSRHCLCTHAFMHILQQCKIKKSTVSGSPWRNDLRSGAIISTVNL